MIQPERDNSIERYIDGSMAPDERREFLDRLDHDEAMQAALHAEALIATAIRNDRAATPGPSAASRTAFLTMLASLPEPNAPLSNADAGGTPTGGGLAASGITKAIVTTVVGVAVTVSAVMMLPHRSPSPAPRPIERPSQIVPAPDSRQQAGRSDGSVTGIPEQTAEEAPAATPNGTAPIPTGARHEKPRTAPPRTPLDRGTTARNGKDADRSIEKPEKEPIITDPTPAQVNVRVPNISN